ncbi:hypothetical protein [Citrobacter farmeri]
MKKARAIPLSACLLAVSCASTTPRSDMTTHPSTPVIQTATAAAGTGTGAASGQPEAADAWLRNSGVSQRDVLANIIDNAQTVPRLAQAR